MADSHMSNIDVDLSRMDIAVHSVDFALKGTASPNSVADRNRQPQSFLRTVHEDHGLRANSSWPEWCGKTTMWLSKTGVCRVFIKGRHTPGTRATHDKNRDSDLQLLFPVVKWPGFDNDT